MLYIFGTSNGTKETMRKNVDIFLKFMWNRWTEQVCNEIFETYLATHIWEKWLNIRDDYSVVTAPVILWMQLDTKCQDAICNYIIETNYKG